MESLSNDAGIDPAWLKTELQEPGRSQSDLGRFLGLDRSKINRMCTGERRITDVEALRIRQYLADTCICAGQRFWKDTSSYEPDAGITHELAELIAIWAKLAPAARRRALAVMAPND